MSESYSIKMPQLSDTMTEGVVVSWEKQLGDRVKRGDIVATVETDKAIMDVEVFRDGYLSGPLAELDSIVPVGEAMAYLVAEESQVVKDSQPASQDEPAEVSDEEEESSSNAKQSEEAQDQNIESAPSKSAPSPRPDNKRASPYARKLAGNKQIDLNSVSGSGPEGVVVAKDISNSQPGQRPEDEGSASAAHSAPEVRVAGEGRHMSAMERAVCHNLSASLSMPTFNITMHAHPEKLLAISKKRQVSFTVMLAKACAQAMLEHPIINSCYQPEDKIVAHTHVDIGMAVATESGGLVVPVLRHCESRDIEDLNEEWRDLLERARKRRLKPEEYTISSFQISNLGMYGVTNFNAIPTPGLGAILAISTTGAEGMPLTLTVDHRVINGAQAAEFLRDLKAVIENPLQWLKSTGPAIPEGDWDYQVVVIGGGPGGEDCARELAANGIKVAMIMDAPYPGGECLWRGCIPSKTWRVAADRMRDRRHDIHLGVEGTDKARLNWDKMEETRRDILITRGDMALKTDQGVKIEVIQGIGVFEGEHSLTVNTAGLSEDPFKRTESGKRAQSGSESELRHLTFGAAVIATGAPPVLPAIEGLNQTIDSGRVLTSDSIWELKSMPKSLAVIGGGAIGLEMAQIFSDFGCKVTLFEIRDRILPEVESEIASKLQDILRKQANLTIHTSTRVSRVKALKKTIKLEFSVLNDKGEDAISSVLVDAVLVATGKKPELAPLNLQVTGVETKNGFIQTDASSRTSVEHIFAVGDVSGGLMLAHTAGAQGRIAAATLLGDDSRYDRDRDCGVIFTRPQAAFAGLTMEQAKSRNLQVVEVKMPMKIDAKAMITAETDGMIKLVVERESQRIVGVHFLADHADTLIGEAVMMVSCGLSLEQVAQAIHPHPTQTELFGDMARRLLARLKRSQEKTSVH